MYSAAERSRGQQRRACLWIAPHAEDCRSQNQENPTPLRPHTSRHCGKAMPTNKGTTRACGERKIERVGVRIQVLAPGLALGSEAGGARGLPTAYSTNMHVPGAGSQAHDARVMPQSFAERRDLENFLLSALEGRARDHAPTACTGHRPAVYACPHWTAGRILSCVCHKQSSTRIGRTRTHGALIKHESNRGCYAASTVVRNSLFSRSTHTCTRKYEQGVLLGCQTTRSPAGVWGSQRHAPQESERGCERGLIMFGLQL